MICTTRTRAIVLEQIRLFFPFSLFLSFKQIIQNLISSHVLTFVVPFERNNKMEIRIYERTFLDQRREDKHNDE